MAGLTEELLNIIQEQNKVYEELLEVGLKKKVAIVENNVENLQKFISKENELVGKNTNLDKKRQNIFKDISFVLNKPLPITLLQIIELIKGQKEEPLLAKAREDSIELLKKLKKINDHNRDLVEISLEQVEYSMNFIRGSVNNSAYYYDSSGNEINLGDKKLFDATQ